MLLCFWPPDVSFRTKHITQVVYIDKALFMKINVVSCHIKDTFVLGKRASLFVEFKYRHDIILGGCLWILAKGRWISCDFYDCEMYRRPYISCGLISKYNIISVYKIKCRSQWWAMILSFFVTFYYPRDNAFVTQTRGYMSMHIGWHQSWRQHSAQHHKEGAINKYLSRHEWIIALAAWGYTLRSISPN